MALLSIVNLTRKIIAIVIFSLLIPHMCLASSEIHILSDIFGTVKAVEGIAETTVEDEQGSMNLSPGTNVHPWEKLSTQTKGKLMIQWGNGLSASLGELSSIVWSPVEDEKGDHLDAHVIGGIVRFTYQPHRVTSHIPYMVTTPTASIKPHDPTEQTDIIVEVHDPTMMTLTVLDGHVRITKPVTGSLEETSLGPCQTALVRLDKTGFNMVAISHIGINQLVEASTISNMLPVDLDSCLPTSTTGLQAYQSREYTDYAYDPEPWSEPIYYDWELFDYFTYEDISVLPYPRPGVAFIIVIGRIGRLIVPIETLGGWHCPPDLVRPFAYHVILNHMLRYHRAHLHHLRNRERDLTRMLYLSHRTRANSLLLGSRGELDDLRIRSNWNSRRIHRLEKRVRRLERDQQRFGGRIPRGIDLYDAINRSFRSQRNLRLIRNLDQRLRFNQTAEKQLAQTDAREIGNLRRSLALTRDPRRRLMLRNRLTGIQRNLASGKMLIPDRRKRFATLLSKASKSTDQAGRRAIAHLALQDLSNTGRPTRSDLLNTNGLNALQKKISVYPKKQEKRKLQQQLDTLRRSIIQRHRAEAVTRSVSHPVEATNSKISKKDKRRHITNRQPSVVTTESSQGSIRRSVKTLGKTPTQVGNLNWRRKNSRHQNGLKPRQAESRKRTAVNKNKQQPDAVRRQIRSRSDWTTHFNPRQKNLERPKRQHKTRLEQQRQGENRLNQEKAHQLEIHQRQKELQRKLAEQKRQSQLRKRQVQKRRQQTELRRRQEEQRRQNKEKTRLRLLQKQQTAIKQRQAQERRQKANVLRRQQAKRRQAQERNRRRQLELKRQSKSKQRQVQIRRKQAELKRRHLKQQLLRRQVQQAKVNRRRAAENRRKQEIKQQRRKTQSKLVAKWKKRNKKK